MTSKLTKPVSTYCKKYHLAILTPGWIELILDGSKTIESRFSKVRGLPFRKVDAGDTVYLKESGGLVLGQFTAGQVETFEDMTRSEVFDLFERYRDKIFPNVYPYFTMGTPPDKWLASKHATLIHVADPVKFDVPFAYVKRDRRAWVVLDAPIA